MLPRPRPLPKATLRAAVATLATGAVLATVPGLGPADVPARSAADDVRPAAASHIVTPGNFQGFGFDQCLAPTQRQMNAWLYNSPFLAAGIYISGKSRACRSQPNLTPAWVTSQLRKGWKLLPITLGPQASCNPRFPRYRDDSKINPNPGAQGRYGSARSQARAEAADAVATAKRLGIAPGSTLWYDMEAFDLGNTHCRESALAFMSAWTSKLHTLDYVSGVYSSAGSGIKALDDARVQRPTRFALPDQIWIARWDGVPNTSTSYIRSDGWLPGGRMKQYQGGHQETWGGVTINIDRNFVDLGKGLYAAPEKHCGGVSVSFRSYQTLKAPSKTSTPSVNQVRALQCLLKERGLYQGELNGKYWKATRQAAQTWQRRNGFAANPTWRLHHWTALLAGSSDRAQKYGSAGPVTRSLQRAINAAIPARRKVTGTFTKAMTNSVKDYQRKVGVKQTGIVNKATWKKLQSGAR